MTAHATSATRDEDLPLHEDVRFLAAALGQVIRRLEGEDAFDTVESLRQATRSRRHGDADAPSLATLLEIARAYIESLDGDRQMLARLEREYRDTVEALLRIRETDVLLADNAVLRTAIGLRNPYVDPLSLIQMAMLRRKRLGVVSGADAERVDAVLATTLSGIAQGMRNTG